MQADSNYNQEVTQHFMYSFLTMSAAFDNAHLKKREKIAEKQNDHNTLKIQNYVINLFFNLQKEKQHQWLLLGLLQRLFSSL